MRTYYDPEDDSFTAEDRCERLAELGDYMRDQMLDRLLHQDGPSPEEIDADAMCDAMCDALDALDFAASSDAAENSPVAMLPADHATTLWGVGDVDAAGEEPISTKPRHEYSQTARALLTRCFNLMTGREINACQIATGDYDTDEGFRAHLIDSLATQFSKEIAEHINQQ